MRSIIFVICTCFALNFKAQIINSDMETYTITTNDTLPVGWKTDSPYSTVPGKTSDAQNGNSAFIINTWYSYAVGMMVNGDLILSDFLYYWIKGGTPVMGKPAFLKGFYKYTNVVSGDSAVAKVILKKWNPALNKPDTIAFGISKLAPTNTYTNFEVAINDFSVNVQPDSIVIYFMSYDYLKGTQLPCADNTCRFLYIDNLTLTQPLGLNETKKDISVSMFYSNDELMVINRESKTFSVSLYSIDGKLISQKEITEVENKIDCSEFMEGVYFVKTNGVAYSNFKFVKN